MLRYYVIFLNILLSYRISVWYDVLKVTRIVVQFEFIDTRITETVKF